MPFLISRAHKRIRLRSALRGLLVLLVFFVPGLVLMGGPAALGDLTAYDRFWELPGRVLVVFALSWKWIWIHGSSVQILLTLLLLFCGIWTWRLLGAGQSASHIPS